MEKLTMKEKVLRFVEEKNGASYTEIIRFVLDTNYGKGTYDKGKGQDRTYVSNPNDKQAPPVLRLVNRWRGYYSNALSGYRPYFLLGKDRLEKIPKTEHRGKYYTIREK